MIYVTLRTVIPYFNITITYPNSGCLTNDGLVVVCKILATVSVGLLVVISGILVVLAVLVTTGVSVAALVNVTIGLTLGGAGAGAGAGGWGATSFGNLTG